MDYFNEVFIAKTAKRKAGLAANLLKCIKVSFFLESRALNFSLPVKYRKMWTIRAIICLSTLMRIFESLSEHTACRYYAFSSVSLLSFIRHPSVEFNSRLDMSLCSQQPLNQLVHFVVVPCGSALLMHRTARAIPELSLMTFHYHDISGMAKKIKY